MNDKEYQELKVGLDLSRYKVELPATKGGVILDDHFRESYHAKILIDLVLKHNALIKYLESKV